MIACKGRFSFLVSGSGFRVPGFVYCVLRSLNEFCGLFLAERETPNAERETPLNLQVSFPYEERFGPPRDYGSAAGEFRVPVVE